jgi:hypothetical protein
MCQPCVLDAFALFVEYRNEGHFSAIGKLALSI